jgi:hypothetical protein
MEFFLFVVGGLMLALMLAGASFDAIEYGRRWRLRRHIRKQLRIERQKTLRVLPGRGRS